MLCSTRLARFSRPCKVRGTIDALDELFATLSYDKPRVIALHFKISEGYTLLMLITTFTSCLILCKTTAGEGWFYHYCCIYPATVMAEWRAVHPSVSYQHHYWLFNCFGGTVWLWSQWYNGLLRKNAHDASEAYQKVILPAALYKRRYSGWEIIADPICRINERVHHRRTLLPNKPPACRPESPRSWFSQPFAQK